MAPDPLRRQAAGAAKRHRAYPQDDPVQEDRSRQGHATEAVRQRPLQRPGQPPPDEVCGRTLLAASGAGAAEASPRCVDYRIAMVTPPTAAEASRPTLGPLSCKITPLAFCNCTPPAPAASAPPAPPTA